MKKCVECGKGFDPKSDFQSRCSKKCARAFNVKGLALCFKDKHHSYFAMARMAARSDPGQRYPNF